MTGLANQLLVGRKVKAITSGQSAGLGQRVSDGAVGPEREPRRRKPEKSMSSFWNMSEFKEPPKNYLTTQRNPNEV